jgi:hypothetical protein
VVFCLAVTSTVFAVWVCVQWAVTLLKARSPPDSTTLSFDFFYESFLTTFSRFCETSGLNKLLTLDTIGEWWLNLRSSMGFFFSSFFFYSYFHVGKLSLGTTLFFSILALVYNQCYTL